MAHIRKKDIGTPFFKQYVNLGGEHHTHLLKTNKQANKQTNKQKPDKHIFLFEMYLKLKKKLKLNLDIHKKQTNKSKGNKQ